MIYNSTMKLLLTSSGLTNKTIEQKLLEMLGKPFEQSKIVFVPTAANVEEPDKAWVIDDMYFFRKLNFESFEMIDIAGAPQEFWKPRFDEADILVFGGGNVKYLLEQMDKSGVRAYLPTVLDKKIYVGISAGSMVTAKTVSLSSAGMLYYEETGWLDEIEGLGFVDFEIRPHLDNEWFPLVTLPKMAELARETPRSFYVLDDDSAVSVEDDNVEVVSEGKWKKFN